MKKWLISLTLILMHGPMVVGTVGQTEPVLERGISEPVPLQSRTFSGVIWKKTSNSFASKSSKPSIIVQSGYGGFPQQLTVANDSSLIATGSDEGVITVWDVETRRLLRQWQAHDTNVEGLHFGPGNQTLVSIGEENERDEIGIPITTVKIWDVETGSLLAVPSETVAGRIEIDSNQHSLSADQRVFAIVSRRLSVILFDLIEGTVSGEISLPLTASTPQLRNVAISPDGLQAAISTGDGKILLWDLASMAETATLEVPGLLNIYGREAVAVHLEFSPLGSYLVAKFENGQHIVFEVDTGEIIQTFGENLRPEEINAFDLLIPRDAVAWSADETSLLIPEFANETTGTGAPRWELIDIRTGERLAAWEVTNLRQPHLREDTGLAVGIGSARIGPIHEAGFQETVEGVMISQLPDLGSTTAIEPGIDPLLAIDLHPYDPIIAVLSPIKGAILADISTADILRSYDGSSARLANITFSPDGSQISTVSSLNPRYPVPGPITFNWLESGSSTEFPRDTGREYLFNVSSADGRMQAYGGTSEAVTIFDNAQQQVIAEISQGETAYSAAFSSDNQRIAIGRAFDGVSIHDVTNGFQELWKRNSALDQSSGLDQTLHIGSGRALAFSPNGEFLLVGDWAGRVHLLDAESGETVGVSDENAGEIIIRDIAISEDGTHFGAVGENGTLLLGQVVPSMDVSVLEGHFGTVTGVHFSADGKLLYSTGLDGFVRVWRVRDGRLLVSLFLQDEDVWGAVTPEGFFAGSETGIELLHVVDGNEVLEFDRFFDALYRPDLIRAALSGDEGDVIVAAGANFSLENILASGLPPIVSELVSVDGLQVDTSTIGLQFDVQPQDGGIGRIELRVNGAVQIIDPPDLGSNATVAVSQDVLLTPGRSQIELIVYNEDNNIASRPTTLEITSTAELAEQPELHVLAIGVNAYQDERIASLNYAVNDAQAIGDAISRAAEQIYDDVTVTYVLDEEATLDNLHRVFADLSTAIRPQDVFVLFLAGHGKTLDGRYYFLPPNFEFDGIQSLVEQGVGQDQWQEWLASIPAQKSVLLYDTCESGSLARDELNDGLEVAAAVERLTRATGRTVVTAASDTEPALEGYGGHGLFSYLVLEAIGAADNDNDGQLEVSELAEYIEDELPDLSQEVFSHRQIPQSSRTGTSFSIGQPTIVFEQN